MQQLVNSRWFSLFDFFLVWTCGVILFIWPQIGGWIIIVALLPWLLRFVTSRNPFQRTGFEFLLLIFILTAGIGVWAAYDRTAAWEKFWILAIAIIFFISLSGQPKSNLGVITGLISFTGIIIAISFVLNNDWNSQLSDFNLINEIGQWLLKVQPKMEDSLLSPNFTGGVLAMIVPLTFFMGLFYFRKSENINAILFWILGAGIIIGLFLTSSRGAWLALLLASILWVIWRVSNIVAQKLRKSPIWIFATTILLLCFPAILFILIDPVHLVELLDKLPGLPSGESRFELAINTTYLISDYPFIGAGLRSFPGSYSRYIMAIPYLLFTYGHNFYLDVFLEQGWLGGVGIIFIFLASSWILLKVLVKNQDKLQERLIFEAILIGLAVALIHGMVDDALYGEKGNPLLLCLPGFAMMLVLSHQDQNPTMNNIYSLDHQDQGTKLSLNSKIIIGLVVFSAILITVFRKPLLASWFANLGAVEMSRQELQDFPSQLNESIDDSELLPAVDLFTLANELDPNNHTANSRMGMIAFDNQDYSRAIKYLIKAHEVIPGHRGVKKILGYAYTWLGQLKNAEELLVDIPEAAYEMEIYTWWWDSQGREDLSRNAELMASMLDS